MGIDKGAMDIWKFGRPRPDLSFNESLAAPEPALSAEETAMRKERIEASLEERLKPLISEALADPKAFQDRIRKEMAAAGR